MQLKMPPTADSMKHATTSDQRIVDLPEGCTVYGICCRGLCSSTAGPSLLARCTNGYVFSCPQYFIVSPCTFWGRNKLICASEYRQHEGRHLGRSRWPQDTLNPKGDILGAVLRAVFILMCPQKDGETMSIGNTNPSVNRARSDDRRK